MKEKLIKRTKAYTLLEVIISLGIIGLILTLFFNILINVINVSSESIGRTVLRDELATITNLVTRDIRNADQVLECGDIIVGGESLNYCEMSIEGVVVRWERCLDDEGELTRVCRYEDGSVIPSFKSSDALKVGLFSFEAGFSSADDPTKRNILFTLTGEHSNAQLDIKNVVRQISASTRNYNQVINPNFAGPVTAANPCIDQSKFVEETFTYTIEPNDDSAVCPWGVGDNNPKGNTEESARIETYINLPLDPNNQNICGFNISFSTNQTIKYDDTFIMTFNDVVLFANNNKYRFFQNYIPGDTRVKLYDWEAIRGKFIDTGAKRQCIGDVTANVAGVCEVPKSEQTGTFNVFISDELQDIITERANDLSKYEVGYILTGDNDEDTDCKIYNPLTFTVNYKYVPLD